jgi:autotransporter-associated beta strand protein
MHRDQAQCASGPAFVRHGRLVVGAVLLGWVGNVSGAIVSSGVMDLAIPSDFEGVYLNVSTFSHSGSEFATWDFNAFFGGLGLANAPSFQPVRSGMGNEDPVLALALGSEIGGGQLYSSGYGGSGAEDDSGHLGPGEEQFTDGVVSFIGFKLAREQAIFYGWIKVTLSRNGSVGMIHEWAYDTSGSAIAAGAVDQLGEIPRVVEQGVAQASSAANAGSGILLDKDSEFTFSEGATVGEFIGNIMGEGEIKITGLGGLRLRGNNSFRGGASVAAGSALRIGKKENLGDGAVRLASAAALEFESSAANDGASNTYANAITVTTETGTLRNTGDGVVVLTGSLSKNGSVLEFSEGVFEVRGVISGALASSDLVVDGATVSLFSENSYNGPTFIRNGGVLSVAALGALPTALARTALTMDDTGSGFSQLRLSVADQSILSLIGAASSLVNLSADGSGHTLVIGDSLSNTTEYAGRITGTGNLVKDGISDQILSGENDFTGFIQVQEGRLRINGVHQGEGDVSVAAGAILGGSGRVAGRLAVSGVLAPGNSIESFGSGALSFLAGSTFAYEFNSTVLNGDLVHSDGGLVIEIGADLDFTDLAASGLVGGSKLTLISYMGAWSGGGFRHGGSLLEDDSSVVIGDNIWRFNYDDTTGGDNFSADQAGATSFVTMTVVPEPSALCFGVAGLACLLRRRR